MTAYRDERVRLEANHTLGEWSIASNTKILEYIWRSNMTKSLKRCKRNVTEKCVTSNLYIYFTHYNYFISLLPHGIYDGISTAILLEF